MNVGGVPGDGPPTARVSEGAGPAEVDLSPEVDGDRAVGPGIGEVTGEITSSGADQFGPQRQMLVDQLRPGVVGLRADLAGVDPVRAYRDDHHAVTGQPV